MATHVARGDEVIKEVATKLTDGDGDEGREKQVADGIVVEAVAAVFAGSLEKDGGSYIYADNPHEGHCTMFDIY